MHWFKGSKRWLSTILFLIEAETLAISLWFSLLTLCSVERTWICSDVWTFWTNYKATLKAASITSASIKFAGLCFAMLHHNTLCTAGTHSPDLPSCPQIWQSTSFWIFFFFCFSIKTCLKIVMNESGFVRRVTVHSQLFNDFDYLLELGENLTACHRQC